KKVFELVKYIKSSECRRNAILNYFEETINEEVINNCCDHCGLNMNEFIAKEKNEVTEERLHDWLQKLSMLLTPVSKEKLGE
ncbi:MAG TPA: RecQ family zinc-binding domain-containing protein, partial [Pseudoneobacillus sp.]|nr:RecQ family zinc-binding domain-containing protein [Pseudoneobacillus sp.]